MKDNVHLFPQGSCEVENVKGIVSAVKYPPDFVTHKLYVVIELVSYRSLCIRNSDHHEMQAAFTFVHRLV